MRFLQELSDQQLKQMLLAYMVLIMKGRPMLEQDLDDACEVGCCRPSAAALAHRSSRSCSQALVRVQCCSAGSRMALPAAECTAEYTGSVGQWSRVLLTLAMCCCHAGLPPEGV